MFSCHPGSAKHQLFTHAPIHDLLYNLGIDALRGPLSNKVLSTASAERWVALGKRNVRAALSEPLKLKITIKGVQRQKA
jgi:hypothetical protein